GYLTTSALLAWATWLGIVPAWLAAFIAVLLVAGPVVVYRAGLRPLAVVRALPAGAVVGLDRWDRAKGWLGRVDDATAQLVGRPRRLRSEEHTSELQSRSELVCRLLLEKKKKKQKARSTA